MTQLHRRKEDTSHTPTYRNDRVITSHVIQNWISLGRVVLTVFPHILFIETVVVRVVTDRQALIRRTENRNYHITEKAADRKLQYTERQYTIVRTELFW